VLFGEAPAGVLRERAHHAGEKLARPLGVDLLDRRPVDRLHDLGLDAPAFKKRGHGRHHRTPRPAANGLGCRAARAGGIVAASFPLEKPACSPSPRDRKSSAPSGS
jgi:hypothetical protein